MGAKSLNKKKFNLFMINYIIGFGFISTIGGIVELGSWGVLSFFITSMIALATALVFSKLAHTHPDTEGSSYGYSKFAFGKYGSFFQGWNQYIQGPLIAASAPLFISGQLSKYDPDREWLYSIISVVVFILLAFASVLNIKKSLKWLATLASVKWLIIAMGFGVAVFLSIRDSNFSANWLSSDTATISTITGGSLSFVFAFGGIEGVTSLTSEGNKINYRKNMMMVFFGIISFYFVFYLVILGIKQTDGDASDLFTRIFNTTFGVTGVVIFVIGFLFNRGSASIGSAIITSKILAPLSHDGYLPEFIGEKNKAGTYEKAIWFSVGLTILSMLIFNIFPNYVPGVSDKFIQVISIGTIAFLVQYLATLVTALKLTYKKELKVHWLEIIVYVIGIIAIAFILIAQLIPPVVGGDVNSGTYIKAISYATFIGLGYLLVLFRKVKTKK